MKGVIKKDLYMIANYCKSYLLFFVVFLIIPILSEGSAFLSAYLFLIPSMAIITVISYDEKNNWETYFEQLPISVKDTVSAKYIIGGTFIIAILLLYSVFAYIRFGSSFIETIMSMSIPATISFAMTMPCYFRYGNHVGRIAYYISLGGIAAIAAQFQASLLNTTTLALVKYSNVLALIGIGLFVASYFISIYSYKIRLKKLR